MSSARVNISVLVAEYAIIICSIVMRTELSVRIILYHFWRCFNISKKEKETLINEDIRCEELRVIGADGSQLGIMPTEKAQNLAIEQNLDLVLIAAQAQPPVAKIMDFGKYRFEQAKREKEARKNQKVINIKEIQLSLNIDTHDFDTKRNAAVKFLSKGDKVKVSIRFRGREMGHSQYGYDLMERFAQGCSEVSNIEKPAKLEGRNMLMFLAPKPVKS